MGKKNRDKKIRGSDGVVFSRLSNQTMAVAKKLEKIYGSKIWDVDAEGNAHEVVGLVRETGFKKRVSIGQDFFYAKQMSIVDSIMLALMGRKKWLSIFVADVDLLDFLENSKPRESDGELIRQAVIDMRLEMEDGIAVHMPGRKESYLIASALLPGEGNQPVLIFYCRGDEIGFLPIGGSGEFEICFDDSEEDIQKDWSLILSLYMYMSAFPDCVKEGPPEIRSGIVAGKSKTISSSVSIREDSERIKSSPHMRRGHFRVLRSEAFKNKRFQSVYVRASMVRGRALTVDKTSVEE